MLELEDGDHRAGDVRIRERPLECSLRIRVGLLPESFETVVPGALQRLHGDHAHVLLLPSPRDDRVQLRPDTVVVGEHHHVEASGVDGGVGHLHQVRRVAGESQESDLAFFLETVEGLVHVLVHQAGDLVAGVYVHQIHVVGAQTREAGLERRHVIRDGGSGGKVPRGSTPLGGEKELIPAACAPQSSAHGDFAAGGRVVGRGVDVVDAPLDGQAWYRVRFLAQGARALDDVGDHEFGASEAPVALDAAALPGFLPVGVCLYHLAAEDLLAHGQPGAEASRRCAGSHHQRSQGHAGSRGGSGKEAAPTGIGFRHLGAHRGAHQEEHHDGQKQQRADRHHHARHRHIQSRR